jgi:hypothetical protein
MKETKKMTETDEQTTEKCTEMGEEESVDFARPSHGAGVWVCYWDENGEHVDSH